MELRPYELAAYESDAFAIRAKGGEGVEFITAYQRRLLQDFEHYKDWLYVLFDSTSVSTRAHQKACLDLTAKLHKLGILPAETQETKLEPKPLRFEGFDSMAALILGILHKPLALFAPWQIFALELLLVLVSVLFFPFESDPARGYKEFPFAWFFLGAYFAVFGALSLRSLFQLAALRKLGRDAQRMFFSFAGPFFYLDFSREGFYMVRRNDRALLALIGLAAPAALIALFVLLHLAKIVSPASVFLVASASLAAAAGLLCPFLKADGAEFLHTWLYPQEKNEKVGQGLRDAAAGRAIFDVTFALPALIALVSFWIYVDSLRGFFSAYAPILSESGMARFTLAFAYFLMLAPFFLVFSQAIDGIRFRSSRKKSAPPTEQVLPVEERMKAIDRIPLFLNLQQQERLALFNEMELRHYHKGDVLITQGEVGDEFFVLVRGRAKATYRDPAGREFHVGNIREGDAFGEVALIDDVPRTATIVARQDCFALVLKKASFQKFVETLGSPERVKQMIRLTGFVRRSPALSRLDPSSQAALIDALQYEPISTNDTIKCDAQTAKTFYVVYSGKLKADTGDDATDRVLETDDFFGYNHPGQTQLVELSVKAVEGSGLLRLDQEHFQRLIWEPLSKRSEVWHA